MFSKWIALFAAVVLWIMAGTVSAAVPDHFVIDMNTSNGPVSITMDHYVPDRWEGYIRAENTSVTLFPYESGYLLYFNQGDEYSCSYILTGEFGAFSTWQLTGYGSLPGYSDITLGGQTFSAVGEPGQSGTFQVPEPAAVTILAVGLSTLLFSRSTRRRCGRS